MKWPAPLFGPWPPGTRPRGKRIVPPPVDQPIVRTSPLVWHRSDTYELASSGPNAGKVETWPAIYANTPTPHKFVRTNDVGPPEPAALAAFNNQKTAVFNTSTPRYTSNAPASFWSFYFGSSGWSHVTVCGPCTPQIDPGNVALVCGIQATNTTQRWQITFGNLGAFPWRCEVYANTMGTTIFNLGANLPVRFLLTICDPTKPQASRVTTRVNNLAAITTSWTQPASSVPGSTMYLGTQAAVDGYRWVGPWAEGIWWGKPLTSQDIITVRDYLNARYLAGLTWT